MGAFLIGADGDSGHLFAELHLLDEVIDEVMGVAMEGAIAEASIGVVGLNVLCTQLCCGGGGVVLFQLLISSLGIEGFGMFADDGFPFRGEDLVSEHCAEELLLSLKESKLKRIGGKFGLTTSSKS